MENPDQRSRESPSTGAAYHVQHLWKALPAEQVLDAAETEQRRAAELLRTAADSLTSAPEQEKQVIGHLEESQETCNAAHLWVRAEQHRRLNVAGLARTADAKDLAYSHAKKAGAAEIVQAAALAKVREAIDDQRTALILRRLAADIKAPPERPVPAGTDDPAEVRRLASRSQQKVAEHLTGAISDQRDAAGRVTRLRSPHGSGPLAEERLAPETLTTVRDLLLDHADERLDSRATITRVAEALQGTSHPLGELAQKCRQQLQTSGAARLPSPTTAAQPDRRPDGHQPPPRHSSPKPQQAGRSI
ncbi:hypothetical protein ABT336_16295 [Micromonospora sp. NPDC000207]|uniref:hypothetical protein n=1 Tax=Micromonospora sp. NPDC000207 TaxID=3154246 RepID=UPI00331CBFE2